MNLTDLQVEVAEWHRKHFPEATATHIVLKLVEEVGELARAHNARILGLRSAQFGKEEDAVGDILIVLAAMCDRWGIELADIAGTVWAEVKARDAERVRR